MLAAIHATDVIVDQFKNALTVTDSPLVWWSFLASLGVAVGTIGLAGFTAVLAFQTREQAKETGISIKQAERHHEQSFMPYLRAEEGISSIEPTTAGTGEQPVQAFKISTRLLSFGYGIAVNIRLSVRLDGVDYGAISRHTGIQPAIPPIGVNDSVNLSDWDIQASTGIVAGGAPRTDAAFVIAYEDVFGRTYRTIYDGRASVRFEGIERA